jgi:hypothetical protein
MSQRRYRAFSPDSGGNKIPETVKFDVKTRIERVAEENFKGKYSHLDIRFRGQFCYIDAFCVPKVAKNWPPKNWPETREELIERLQNTPTHLCRFRYFGQDQWGFAFYKYSDEKYELAVYPNGEFLGRPEDAFFVSASMYLQD